MGGTACIGAGVAASRSLQTRLLKDQPSLLQYIYIYTMGYQNSHMDSLQFQFIDYYRVLLKLSYTIIPEGL